MAGLAHRKNSVLQILFTSEDILSFVHLLLLAQAQFCAQRSWETICNNCSRFCENSWEPMFNSFDLHKHVVKQTLKLKNISVYYYLQKNLWYLLKSQQNVTSSVK